MGQQAQYAAAGSLVKALHSRSLGPQGLEELAGTRDVTAAIEFLRGSAYSTVFPRAQVQRVLRPLEHLLKQMVIADGEKLARFVPLKMQKVLQAYVSRFEVANIKTILGAILSEGALPDIENWMFAMGRFALLDLDICIRCQTLEEILDTLSETVYQEPIKKARTRFEVIGTLFPLEHELDRYHFLFLWETIRQSFGEDSPVAHLVRMEIDICNVQWASRLRLNFHVPAEEVRRLLIPHGYYSRAVYLDRLTQVSDLDDVFAVLPPWGHRMFDKGNPRPRNLIELSELLERRLLSQVLCILAQRPFSPEAELAHLYWRGYEVGDITTIIESKRYRLPFEQVRPFLCTVKTQGEAV